MGAWATLAVGMAALYSAFELRWVSDDAFISYRYAENLVQGLGLVFNEGERVEGFTNLSWTLLTALAMRFGLDPVVFTEGLGLFCYGGCLLLMVRTSLGFPLPSGGSTVFVPLAAIGWCLHAHARIFATSGLETPLFVLLVTGVGVATVEAKDARDWRNVGIWGALAVLTRPDGALFYGIALGAALVSPLRGRALRSAAFPGALVLLPVAAWKLWWFGDLVPNTFYAKAGHGARWEEGWAYLSLYGRMYWVLVLGALAGTALAFQGGGGCGWNSKRSGWILAAFFGGTCVYLARVGGDFMFARFLLPISPLALLALESWGRSQERVPFIAVSGVALGGLLLARAPTDLDFLSPDDVGVAGVVEERNWYPAEWVQEAQRWGDVVARAAEGTDLRLAFHGTQAMLAYYTHAPYALEAHVGLTDRELARRTPKEGMRLGHGVKADLPYLRSRDIDLRLDFRLEQPVTHLTAIDFGKGVTGRILTYRREVLDVLASRGVKFVDFPSFLDDYLAEMDDMPEEKVRSEYASFQSYYFQHNDDPARNAAFEARLELGG
jgi:hypothetical protein